jgi:hypothetical protein
MGCGIGSKPRKRSRPSRSVGRGTGVGGVAAGGGAVVSEKQHRADGLPALSSGRSANDEQSGGVAGGEFNARVKGKQKFGNRPSGAEAVLQVRAALLSEDGRLERYFAERPGSPYRRRVA